MQYRLLIAVIAFALLGACKTVYHIDDAAYSHHRLTSDNVVEDADVEALLLPYRQEMDEAMNEVLIESETSLTLTRPESTMGNFAADATEAMAEWYLDEEVDFAIHNHSGIRIKAVGAGGLKLGSIYEMMPFDNYLVTVKLSGAEVLEVCQLMAERGGWPSSAGLRYAIADGQAQEIELNGKSIKIDETYTLATNNYIIESANYLDFFKTKEMNNSGVYVRDAIAEYLRSLNEAGVTLKVELDQRVRIK